MDESWLDTNCTFQNAAKGIIKRLSSQRLITVHTGSKNGFLPRGLRTYEAGQTRGVARDVNMRESTLTEVAEARKPKDKA
jgi:hypothetical protein